MYKRPLRTRNDPIPSYIRTFQKRRFNRLYVYILTRLRALLLDGTLLTASATLRRQPLSNYYTGLRYGGIRRIRRRI